MKLNVNILNSLYLYYYSILSFFKHEPFFVKKQEPGKHYVINTFTRLPLTLLILYLNCITCIATLTSLTAKKRPGHTSLPVPKATESRPGLVESFTEHRS